MKKLLNKRGSVLFLVVVVMALLLVAASATYYVVRNQHASANTHYNSEQSYQTAYSVSEVLEDYIFREYGKVAAYPSLYNSSILKKMMDMEKGEENALTAKNDFTEYGLGDFDIKIVKDSASTPDEGIFEITTRAETNGETTSLTQVWKIKLAAAESKYFTRFLTSTGVGVGEDTYLKVQQIFGDTYFENEFTSVSSPTIINRPLYSSGTFIDNGITYQDFTDKEVVIAGNYYIGSDSRDIRIGKIFVGGDMEINRSSQHMYCDAIYVLGDLNIKTSGDLSIDGAKIFVQGDCHISGKFSGNNTTIYVGNNLYIEGYNTWKANATFYVNKNVYFLSGANGDGMGTIYYGGKLYGSDGKTEITSSNIQSNGSKDLRRFEDTEGVAFNISDALQSVKDSEFTGWSSVGGYISDQTFIGTYQAWNALGFFETDEDGNKGKYADAPTFDLSEEISNSNGFSNYKISNSKKESTIERPNLGQNQCLVTIKETCKLRECSYGADRLCIIIDASDEDIYIYLDDNGTGTFRFASDFGDAVNVFIKGSHPVIFVLPEGVTFKAGKNQFIGHYDLAKKIANTNQFDDPLWLAQGQNIVSGKLQDKGNYDSTLGDAFTTDTDEDGIEYSYLDSAKFNDEKVHNNIFLVSRDNNKFDFNEVNTLAGYIYAPKTVLEINANGGYMQFFGGLIVGSYKYDHQSALLAFCSPYDPYNTDSSGNVIGSSVVSNLISQASGGVINGSGNPSGGAQNVSVEFVGYR